MTNAQLFEQFYLVVVSFSGIFGFSIGLLFWKGFFKV